MKRNMLKTSFTIFVLVSSMALMGMVLTSSADGGSVMQNVGTTSMLDGSYVEVVPDTIYEYSLGRSGSSRYDEFYLTVTGASEITATMEFSPRNRVESSDDFDLYGKYGSRISSCSSSTCSDYDVASMAGGNSAESVTFTNPADGTYHFRVQRYSGWGTEYFFFQVTVTAGTGDTTAPTVSITSPSDGSTVSDTVAVSSSASDNVGVDRVEFRVDGALKATDTSAPYSFNWDTTTATNGNHDVSATAFDAAGNSAVDTHTYNVDNQGTPPPTGCGETPRVTGSMPFWHDAIDAEGAHAAGCYGGDSVVVILDTGLNSGSYGTLFPAGSINTQYSTSYTLSGGYDNVDWDEDTEGHGTSVAATVLGYYVPSSWGFTNNYAQGVAPNAEIVMYRVVYWVGAGVSYDQMVNNWAQAINDAVSLHNNNAYFQNRGMIISMSLGYDESFASSSANSNLANAIANARASGVVVSTSAGNDGPSPNTTGYPANIDDSTSVAAAGWSGLTASYGVAGILTDLPENDFSGLLIADFSSRGKVEITGMGWQLVLPSYNGNFYYTSGTSFSCPQVSGVFALMFGAYGATSTVNYLESTMQSTAYNGPNGSSGSMSSSTWGSGFVQADAAVGA